VSDADAAPAQVGGSVAPEDQARADFYALLARLYADAPDRALLHAIGTAGELPVESAEEAAKDLARSWRELARASALMDPDALAQEYQDLFVGIGKSEVSLHASAYLPRTGVNLLAELRSEFATFGLARRTDVALYEDHLASLCEVMRALVAGAPGVAGAPVGRQRAFFSAFVASWVGECCSAIRLSPIANYYLRVAEFTQAFIAVERESFAIE
jgi:TorA maturation chaperone TorD